MNKIKWGKVVVSRTADRNLQINALQMRNVEKFNKSIEDCDDGSSQDEQETPDNDTTALEPAKEEVIWIIVHFHVIITIF